MRRGRPGTHWQRIHAPTAVLNGRAQAPSTRAQYPHPARPKQTETMTETARAMMSLIATAENSIARFNNARCNTDRFARNIVADIPAAIGATCASPKNFANKYPDAAKREVSS